MDFLILENKQFFSTSESKEPIKVRRIVKVGNSHIDFKGLLIDSPSGLHSVEPKVMKLLKVLVENAGQVMTREDLITQVWGIEHGGDESLSRGISILRKILGDKRGQYTHIVTISRVGYRLIADVSEDISSADIYKTRPTTTSVPIETPAPPHSTDAPHAEEPPTQSVPLFLRKSRLFRLTVPALALMLIGFFAIMGLRGLNAPSNTGNETIQSQLDRGFSHVSHFTLDGAIVDAQNIFGDILNDNPDHAAARAGLALAVFREYTHLERDPSILQRATAHAEAALRANEHLALANIASAWAAEFDGDFERSHERLDRADILEANNKFALEGRYRTFGKQGELDKAKAVIDQAISSYPNSALFHAYRGGLYMLWDDYPQGEADFRQAIKLAPDNPRTYAELAHSLHQQDRTAEAIDVIQDGLNVNETALLYNNLGTYLFFQGQYGLAASAFEKTLDLSGDTHNYLYWANLGDAYRWSAEKSDQAATHYRRALQLLQVDLDRYPDDDNLKSRAAMFNAKLGNLDQAQAFMDSFDLTSDSPSIQLYRAVVTYEIMSNRAKALEFLEATISADYPMTEILHDPELARLRQDPAYHRLLAKTLN